LPKEEDIFQAYSVSLDENKKLYQILQKSLKPEEKEQDESKKATNGEYNALTEIIIAKIKN